MAPQGLIALQSFKAVEVFSKRHLVKAFVDAPVAQSANPNAGVQRALVYVFAKISAAMDFAGDQVVERQINEPIA